MNSEWLFDEYDRERLRELIWAAAEFCGVDVLTYVVLSNHFHVVVRVPERELVEVPEVFRRYSVLYSGSSRYQPEKIDQIRRAIEDGMPEGMSWLEMQRRQMGDLSHYMKIVKQRFSVLFNRKHKRHGTLWSERYTSTLLEAGRAVQSASIYTDLNSVRAGIVVDPKDYRYCGYAESVAGSEVARAGVKAIVVEDDWEFASCEYRILLFGTACKPREKGKVLDVSELEKVVRAGGKLTLQEITLARIRYFSNGAVLGSPEFVKKYLDLDRLKYGRVRGLEPKALPPIAEWGGLTVMRRPRAGICVSSG